MDDQSQDFTRYDHHVSGGDDTHSEAKRDPLAPPIVEDFDWDALKRALGEAVETAGQENLGRLAEAIEILFRFVSEGRDLRLIGKKTVALIWIVSPSYFGGPSAAKLARQFGIHPVTLQIETGKASRRFNFRNRSQSHYRPKKKPAALPNNSLN